MPQRSATWHRARPLLTATMALLLLCAGACAPRQPLDPLADDSLSVNISMQYGDSLRSFLSVLDGSTGWRWHWTGSAADSARGTATLVLAGCGIRWRLHPAVAPQRSCPPLDRGRLELIPDDPLAWHALSIALPPSGPAPFLPMPRQSLDSAYYADLLDLLQCLTAGRFRQRVAHWPEAPVPVAIQPAVSGELDLAACLAEAVIVWNAGEPTAPFVSVERADWGVRLVHIPDPLLSPRMYLQIETLDGAGRPLRMKLVAGDAYTTIGVRRYAVRGMLHELAHARLLWGHSEDRHHLLWRCGPIVDTPSLDERRAARLWELLPDGHDLSAYGRSGELDPPRQQSQRTPVK